MSKRSMNKTGISVILDNAEGSWRLVSCNLAAYLLSCEMPVQDFQMFMETFEPVLYEKNLPDVEEENKSDWDKLLALYGELVIGFVRVLSEKNEEKEKFYSSLWRLLQEKDMFPDVTSLAAALFVVMKNPNIPYFQLPEGVQMSDADYQLVFKQQMGNIRYIMFIMLRQGLQRTEKASILLNVIDAIEDPGQKAVVMSYIMSLSAQVEKDRS